MIIFDPISMPDKNPEILRKDSPYPADLTEPSPDLVVDGPKPPILLRFWLSLKRGVVRKLLSVWSITLVLSLFVIYALEGILPDARDPVIALFSHQFYIVAVISFVSMYLNSALGMGYGITIIPIFLIFFGYNPVLVLAPVLTAQFLAEIGAGISHSEAGNIDFAPGSQHFKVTMVLSGCGIIGAIAAVSLFVQLNQLNTSFVTLAIGAAVIVVGLIILLTLGRNFTFSWRKIVALGLIASFIKGFTGGGYGPIVTGGQLLCGVGGKQAIGIKSVAEGLTCLVAVMMLLASGEVHDMTLGYPLVLGAICSLPFSAYTVRQIGTKRVTTLIGIITITLGIILQLKTLYFPE